MKLLKYFFSGLVFLIMIIITLVTIPFFLLLDGGIDALKTLLQPTILGKALSSRIKTAH